MNMKHAFEVSKTDLSEPERQLWATVLLLAVEDALSATGCTLGEHEMAQRWFGTYPSRQFRDVCNLAGLDGQAVHDRLRPKIEAAREETQRKYYRRPKQRLKSA